jgi:6,7-dimethyl-8-ribityllumazine synthase
MTQMTRTRYAFIKADWHAEIVDQALAGFCEIIDPEDVDVLVSEPKVENP